MPAEIGAGDLFPIPRFVQDKDPLKGAERHRDLLAQALNEVASAAFSVQILADDSATAQDTTTSFVDYAGLSLDVISPVPASVIVAVLLDVEAKTWTAPAAGSFFARLKRDGVLQRVAFWVPSAQGMRTPFLILSANTDLLPATTYSYTVEIQTTGAGTNVYTVNKDGLANRTLMAAVVLPRLLS